MNVVLSGIVLALVAHSWWLGRKVRKQSERIEQLGDRLYSWGAETRSHLDEIRGRLRVMDLRMRRSAGENVVSPDMLISEVLAIHPRMKEVLASVHLGGCSSCSVSSAETLRQGAASYGLDIDSILSEIERFLEDPEGYRAEPKPHGNSQGIQIQIPERREA